MPSVGGDSNNAIGKPHHGQSREQVWEKSRPANSVRRRVRMLILLAGGVFLTATPTLADPQQEAVHTTFLATFHAPTDPTQVIATDFSIISLSNKPGYIRGPRINGKPIQPCGDWITTLPDGKTLHTDDHCTIRTDDGSLVYIEYTGVFVWNDAALAKCQAGGLLGESDVYFRTQPRFRAGEGQYSWLNGVAAVGKMTALKCGAGSYAEYDIYLVN